jgi:hypothetical protein
VGLVHSYKLVDVLLLHCALVCMLYSLAGMNLSYLSSCMLS